MLLTRAMLMLHKVADFALKEQFKHVFFRRRLGQPATLHATSGTVIIEMTEAGFPSDSDYPHVGSENTDSDAARRHTNCDLAIPCSAFEDALKKLPSGKVSHDILKTALLAEGTAIDNNVAAIATTDLSSRTIIREDLKHVERPTIDAFIAKCDKLATREFRVDAGLLEYVLDVARAHTGTKKGQQMTIVLDVPVTKEPTGKTTLMVRLDNGPSFRAWIAPMANPNPVRIMRDVPDDGSSPEVRA